MVGTTDVCSTYNHSLVCGDKCFHIVLYFKQVSHSGCSNNVTLVACVWSSVTF